MQVSYPYQDKLLRNQRGEKWKDVEGFEGSYQVSNKGRAKSLDRYVNHKSGKPVLVTSQILAQTTYRYFNRLTKDYTVALRVAFSKDGARHDFQVRRMVYQAFIGKLKLNKGVINKDGDGFNNMVNNLITASASERQKRSIARGRQIPCLINLDRSKFKKTWGGYSRSKKVIQLTLDGKRIRTFPSIREASRQTGIDDKSIINVAKGRWSHTHNFVWKYWHLEDRKSLSDKGSR